SARTPGVPARRKRVAVGVRGSAVAEAPRSLARRAVRLALVSVSRRGRRVLPARPRDTVHRSRSDRARPLRFAVQLRRGRRAVRLAHRTRAALDLRSPPELAARLHEMARTELSLLRAGPG